jgi:hypothetical protein
MPLQLNHKPSTNPARLLLLGNQMTLMEFQAYLWLSVALGCALFVVLFALIHAICFPKHPRRKPH